MPIAGLGNIIGADQRLAFGTHTTVAASDTVVTGLKRVDQVVVCLQSDPVDDPMLATAVPNADGTITIKTWKNTGGTDPTPAAASTFSKLVNWIAVGW